MMMTKTGIKLDPGKIEKAMDVAFKAVEQATEQDEQKRQALETIIRTNSHDECEGKPWGVSYFDRINYKTGGKRISSWEEFKEKLTHPPKIPYTVNDLQEFKNKNEDKYKKIKFAGGLYTGYTFLGKGKGGADSLVVATKANPPENFYLIALDYDRVESWLEPRIRQVLDGLQYFCHTTATSTSDAPRIRLIIPFAKGVDGEARDAFGRVIAEKIGWAGLDDSSLRWTQRMAFPIETQDVPYRYIEGTGQMVDVLEYLEREFPDWKQAEKRPTGGDKEKKQERIRKSATKPCDVTPEEYLKQDTHGLIKAFCEVYKCNNILKQCERYKILSQTEKETRWSRKRDEAGGIVVYHHNETCACFLSTDVLAGEKCLNAFSLAVILLYGGDFKEAINHIKKDLLVITARLAGRFTEFAKFEDVWGDTDLYPLGWKGVLKRVVDAYPIKTIIQASNNGKTVQTIVKWDGTRYVPISIGSVVGWISDVCEFCSIRYSDLEKELQRYVSNAGTAKTLAKEIFSIEEIKTTPDDWDSDPWLVNCIDGVVNIKGFCQQDAKKRGVNLPVWQGDEPEIPFREHTKNDLFLKRTNFRMSDCKDEDAQKRFMDFLDSVQPSKDVQIYMQTAIGSSLGDCSTDNIFIWMPGKAGAGKSTLVKGLEAGLGDYYGTADISNFYTGNKVDDPTKPQPQLDKLRGVKVAVFSEASADRTVDCAGIKKWFGSTVCTRTLHDIGGPWTPRFRGICDCNEMPKLNNPSDGGIRRRFRVIPWNIDQTANMDATIAMRFSSDPKIQAVIFLWLLRGCSYWAERGFLLDAGLKNAPQNVISATNAYFSDVDDIGQYIDDNIKITNDCNDFVPTDIIWNDYGRSGFCTISERNFYRRIKAILEAKGVEEARRFTKAGPRKRGYLGIQLLRRDETEVIETMTGRSAYSYNYSECQSIMRRAEMTLAETAEDAQGQLKEEKNTLTIEDFPPEEENPF